MSLNTTFTRQLDSKVFLFIRLNNISRWALVIIGVVGLLVSGYMLTNSKKSFSLSTFHLRNQEINVDGTTPNKNTMLSSLSEIMTHKRKT